MLRNPGFKDMRALEYALKNIVEEADRKDVFNVIHESDCPSFTYIASSCNKSSNSVDWCEYDRGFLCVAFKYSVGLCKANDLGWLKLKNKVSFDKRISALCCLKSVDKNFTYIVVGTVDGDVIIFDTLHLLSNGTSGKAHRTNIHQRNITAVLGELVKPFNPEKSQFIMISSSLDSTIVISKFTKPEMIEKIAVVEKYPVICQTISLQYLPVVNRYIVALGCDNAKVYVYLEEKDQCGLIQLGELSGHKNWILKVNFSEIFSDNSLFLASASEDSTVRLWKLKLYDVCSPDSEEEAKFAVPIDDKYLILMEETVLSGHSHWVVGVNWIPQTSPYAPDTPLKLVTSSGDKTVIIWHFNNAQNLWEERHRFGTLGGQAVGFYGSGISTDGTEIFAHDFKGSIHHWMYDEMLELWLSRPGVSGHDDQITDVTWDESWSFVFSASKDGTVRIHSGWKDEFQDFWFELSRPVIHGHPCLSIGILPNLMMALSSEEKEVRIYQPPRRFFKLTRNLCDLTILSSDGGHLPDAAQVPDLGLSNRALYGDYNFEIEEQFNMLEPPMEELLQGGTLWPEIQKLFYHSNALSAIAVRPDGAIVISASQGSGVHECAIAFWECKAWTRYQIIEVHENVVSKMVFSPDGLSIVTIGKDMLITILHQAGRDTLNYNILAKIPKSDHKHMRLISACNWSPDSNFVMTASHDGTLCPILVAAEHDKPMILDAVNHHSGISKLAFAPDVLFTKCYLLAVGYSTGDVRIYYVQPDEKSSKWILHLNYIKLHVGPVSGLMFIPQWKLETDKTQPLLLASGGVDKTLLVSKVPVAKDDDCPQDPVMQSVMK